MEKASWEKGHLDTSTMACLTSMLFLMVGEVGEEAVMICCR
jgi:hypothetical protein